MKFTSVDDYNVIKKFPLLLLDVHWCRKIFQQINNISSISSNDATGNLVYIRQKNISENQLGVLLTILYRYNSSSLIRNP